jgi:hypothetical protein
VSTTRVLNWSDRWKAWITGASLIASGRVPSTIVISGAAADPPGLAAGDGAMAAAAAVSAAAAAAEKEADKTGP